METGILVNVGKDQLIDADSIIDKFIPDNFTAHPNGYTTVRAFKKLLRQCYPRQRLSQKVTSEYMRRHGYKMQRICICGERLKAYIGIMARPHNQNNQSTIIQNKHDSDNI